MVALTEKRTVADIDRLAEVLADVLAEVHGMKLIYERSQAGPPGAAPCPTRGCPCREVPEGLRRSQPPRLPELAEPELVRHCTRSRPRNFGIDTGFYPLGSCTMKYNPRVNERVVGLPGFRDLHPYQERGGLPRARWS